MGGGEVHRMCVRSLHKLRVLRQLEPVPCDGLRRVVYSRAVVEAFVERRKGESGEGTDHAA